MAETQTQVLTVARSVLYHRDIPLFYEFLILFQFLIMMTGLASFAIPVTEVGERLIVCGLVILTAFTYRYLTRPTTPLIAYWTTLVGAVGAQG